MFTKNHSTMVKGVAIFMMMWHHCFLPGRYEQYPVVFLPLAESQAVNIATYFKICVSLFVFVSGYGLYLSYNGRSRSASSHQTATGWVLSRSVKTLSGYWFVLAAAWVICAAVDGLPLEAYDFDRSWLYGIFRAALDFLGLSNFFGFAPMNSTWWYMSAAVVFILLTPLLYEALERIGWLCVCAAVFILPRLHGEYPGGISFWSFLPMFCVGMAFAQSRAFEKWDALWSRKPLAPPLRVAGQLLLLALSYKLYYWLPTNRFWDIKYAILPLPVILFIRDYISRAPVVREALLYLGRQSMNVFLIHSFIRYYYCESFVYGMKYMMAIILALLFTSLALSEAVEFAKRLTHYDQWIGRICTRIEETRGLERQP